MLHFYIPKEVRNIKYKNTDFSGEVDGRFWVDHQEKKACVELHAFHDSNTCNSSSVKFSPSSLATLLRFLNEIFPVQSSSNKRKAFIISSLESFSPCKQRWREIHNGYHDWCFSVFKHYIKHWIWFQKIFNIYIYKKFVMDLFWAQLATKVIRIQSCAFVNVISKTFHSQTTLRFTEKFPGFALFHITVLTIFCVIMLRKSAKSIVPEPSLSMSAIIFLISSFFGSNPRALMATCGRDRTHLGLPWHCNLGISESTFDICIKPSTNLQLLHVYSPSSICVKKIKSLLDFLLLLFCQFNFGTCFFLLAGRSNWFTVI